MVNDIRVLYLSSFPPRICGIADFCQNVIEAVCNVNPLISQNVVAINEIGSDQRNYPSLVKWQLHQEDLESYKKTALWINESGADVLFLQHEYGLFGGFDGVFVLKLLEKLKVPVVSFLHSIPVLKKSKGRNYRLKILKGIAKKSKFLILTSLYGKRILEKECAVKKEKIVLLRHGGFDIPFPEKKEREKLKTKYGFQKRFLVLTYGLITKSKGIDVGIEAIKRIKNKYPQILYLILGAQHPVRLRGLEKEYYLFLEEKVKSLSLEKNILFLKRFLQKKELIFYLKMADTFLLPYRSRTQTSSGVLANAITTGNCILSTPFLYAKELLKNQRGFFIKFEDPNSIARVLSFLIENPDQIEKTKRRTYLFGRNFTWTKVAQKLIEIFQKAKVSQR